MLHMSQPFTNPMCSLQALRQFQHMCRDRLWPLATGKKSAMSGAAKYISPFGNNVDAQPVLPGDQAFQPYASLPNTPDIDEAVYRPQHLVLNNAVSTESHI